jgi:hypothetical protein
MELSDYKFIENPFRIGPPLSPTELIWAGFPKLRQSIEKRIEFSMLTTPSRIVLNWGRYGSGKTHAANFFTRTKALSDISTRIKCAEAKTIKITLPRTSKDPVQAFFRSFLGQISLANIKEDLSKVENFTQIINAISTDSVICNLFKLIYETDSNKLENIESYLFGDTTKTMLTKLNLPLGLKDDEQIVNFIGTYLNAITFNKKLYSAFILWIDEFEDIDTLNKSSQDRFTTFMRQLFDTISNNFLLFLNFTPKTFYNIEDLSLTLGEALSTRAKLRIEFDIPNIDEAKNYIKELISHPINRSSSVENVFFPFNEEVVNYILDHIGNLSVRKINEVFSLLLEMGIIEGKSEIDIEFIMKNKDEIISWKD